MSKFVKPETLTLSLSDGDSITIKKRLTTGESRAMYARMYTSGVEPMRLDPATTIISQVAAYLVDWSLTDDDGQKIALAGLTPEQITLLLDGLDPDWYREIRVLVQEHVEAMDAMRDEKKTVAGTTEPSAI